MSLQVYQMHFGLRGAHARINAELDVDPRIVRFAYRSSSLRRVMAVPGTHRSAHWGQARGLRSLAAARDTTRSMVHGHSGPLKR